MGFAVKVLVAIHYSVLAARNGYTRNAIEIIEESTAAYASPVVMVEKPDGTKRG